MPLRTLRSCSQPAPISWSAAAAAFRAAPSPSLRVPRRARALAWKARRRGCHRQPGYDRHRRIGSAPRRGLSWPCRRCGGPRYTANPQRRHHRRQPRAALALLVLPQSAHGVPQEGRQRVPGPPRQPPLRRDLRPRALRGAASLHARRRPPRLRSDRDDQPAQGSGDPGPVRRRPRRHARPHARAGGADPDDQTCRRRRRASGPPTVVPSAAPMPSGRWWRRSFASCPTATRSGSLALPAAASLRCPAACGPWRKRSPASCSTSRLSLRRPSAPPMVPSPCLLTGYKVALLEGLVASMLAELRA